MNPDALITTWNDLFPRCPPIGYMLRQFYHDQWIRFHTLGNGKRTPETSLDNQVVLDRLEKIAETLFVAGEPIMIFMTAFSEDETLSRMETRMNLSPIGVVPGRWLAAIDQYAETSGMRMMCGIVNWEPHCVDELLLAAAQDEIGSLTLFSDPSKNVICPYDGGVDIFLRDPTTRTLLAQQFRSWLPDAS